MPTKRGRPLSNPDPNPAIQRAREQARRRRQALIQRRRQDRAATILPSIEQNEQQNLLLEQSFTENHVPSTLLQLGLRVQGLTLAQDFEDAQLQREATDIDEHHTLYDPDRRDHTHLLESHRAPPPQSLPQSLRAPRRPIADFFTSNPRSNSFSHPSSRVPNATLPTSTTPVRPSFSPFTDIESSLPLLPTRSSISAENNHIDYNGFSDDEIDPHGVDENGESADSKNQEPDTTERESAENELAEDAALAEDGSDEPDIGEREEENGPVEEDEEEIFYDFLSEHSSNHSTPEPELSALDFTADKVFEMMQEGCHGCSGEDHTVQLQQHLARHGENHHGLNALFAHPRFYSVLPLSEFITYERLQRQRAPSRRQWADMFCGVPAEGPSRRPRQACLHAEETRAVPPDIAFDIDSLLGFATSLAVARQGIHCQPAPQIRQNLRTDVHLHTTVHETNDHPDLPARSRPAMLKDVPHFHFGRVEGAADISLYILFPHMAVAHDRFIGLTNEQHSRWLNQVVLPAIHQEYGAHYTQHLPASHRHALANSKARQVEDRQAESASYQAQQTLTHFLQPDRLHDVWDHIIDTTTHTPGLHDFREPQLFFSAKGTKLQFKTSPSRPTALDTLDTFQAYFERIMDLEYVMHDRFYVDLGKEICAPASLLRHDHATVDDEAQVYLWRRCCLEQHLRWLYGGPPPKSGQTFYNVSMLRDACNLTSLTPKRSRLREGGLVYSQFYSSVKEMTDAAKSFPFQNDGLEELALDPQIRQSARNAAGAAGRHNATVIQAAYHASKRRTHFALTDSRQKSFGVREEHRISWPLLLALRGRLEREARERLAVVLVDCPTYVWPIRTAVYADFLWRNVDKFATGFEVALARCAHDFVTWEQTKVMAMFLRCLRFALAAHQFSRESALWWSRRETGDPQSPRVWYGLGFSNTISRYGYAWIEPRLDFERLAFQVPVTDHVLFGNQSLRQRYLKRGGAVRDFHNNFLQLERAVTWLQEHHASQAISDRLTDWIVHICLRQFRVDTLTTVGAEIHPDHHETALDGLRPFSHDYLEETMAYDALHLVSGNKSAFKTPRALKEALFGYDDERKRDHWENKPYRTLYERACTTLSARPRTAAFTATIRRRLARWLFAFHWILPYPGTSVFTQTTKDGQRMWYSIQPTTDAVIEDGDLPDLSDHRWEWAQKNWRPGHPPALPRYLRWTTQTWEEWIARH